MVAVTVESLVKTYGTITALQNLSFAVQEASMYGIIGPDGAGKTTFMRIASCLLFQSSGTVTVGGFDTLTGATKVKRIIGYMPQRFSLYQDLSVWENLVFFADLFGVSGNERRRRIDELLSFSRLGPFVKRRAGQLSGGMKQKLALSCTLIHKPEVLFLDEPTTGVDPVSRREFWEILASLKSSGTTIIVSTPYMDEAARCDRVGLILGGVLIREGTPDSFPAHFKNELLAVRGADIVRMTRKLVFPDIVLDVSTFGDRMHLTVGDAEAAIPVIVEFLKERSITNVTVERIEPSIEDVFVEHMVIHGK
ncbi:ABC transporter ATP-binding protein [bacterium]|nr:ABC transporter ATP-binding protein [bacterium]